MSNRVLTYDTTLRDGAQTEGISFSVVDKLEILSALDAFGIDFVEGGWPGSNPKDDEFFESASKVELKNTRLVAFGSTCRPDTKVENDPNLKALAECGTEWCAIFGKAWDFQVTDVLEISLERNLEIVRDSIRFLKDSGKHVIFDAEHYFDAFKSNREYASSVLKAAMEGGAEYIVLCDTNGGSTLDDVRSGVEGAKAVGDVPFGAHFHNDAGLAVANSMVAVETGCTMVQGTINGLGERCGNADLCTLMPNLAFKEGADLGGIDLKDLTGLSKFVGETVNLMPGHNAPYVGESAFSHKGGVHASAVSKDTLTYEHIDPSKVGNARKVLVSEMAGRANITKKLKELGLECTDDASDIAMRIKDMESRGYTFEGADASFELLVKRLRGDIEPKFTVKGFKILMDNHVDGFDSEASIKVLDVDGNLEQTAADGNGPVNALDKALRKSIGRFYPEINDIRLTDYKVRILDSESATAAGVRVLIRSSNGKESWTTVGVSENIVKASLIALVDSLEYALMIGDNE